MAKVKVEVEPVVSLRGVQAGDVVRGLELDVLPGETVVLVGPGREFSNLVIKLILGLERPVVGQVRLLGENPMKLDRTGLLRLRATCGVVPARGQLISNLSVLDNIALPYRYHDVMAEAELKQRVLASLGALELDELAGLRPDSLTKAEKTLVAMIRATLLGPAVLLLEDVFEGMEEVGYSSVMALIRHSVNAGTGVIMMTKRKRLATSFDGNLLRMPNGRIETWA